MKDFNAHMEESQIAWRSQHIGTTEEGAQNGVCWPWILPAAAWEQGLWSGIRDRLPVYLREHGIQRHKGSHNLKSSWTHGANLYFPFEQVDGLDILGAFLQARVSANIQSVVRIDLEWAEPSPLDPQTLLGEPSSGTRGANQTSPDVAFLVRTTQGGQGIVLTENKLTEHSFYSCSGRKRDVANPDASRCLDWPAVQADPGTQCWQTQWEQPGRPNRTYWKHLQFSTLGKQTLTRCPAATAAYQLFRQQALAEAIAANGDYQFVASCVAYDARNDDLIHSLRSTGVDHFARGWGPLFTGQVQFSTWTHQDWVAWVREHDTAGKWLDWLQFVENRYGYTQAAS